MTPTNSPESAVLTDEQTLLLTHSDAIRLWHANNEVHQRESAFEWFSAGLIAAEREVRAKLNPPRDPRLGGSSYEASMLRNLLARIHGDGGHYVAEHGLDKALDAAEQLVASWRAALSTSHEVSGEVATKLPGLQTLKIVARDAFMNGLAWMEANGESIPKDWSAAANDWVERWAVGPDNPLNYPHECDHPSCGCDGGPCAAEEANERIAERLTWEASAPPSPQPATTPSAEPARTTERHIALREAHCIEKIDKFFAARRSLDGPDERKCFEEGFKRGFDAAEQCFPAATKQPAGEVQEASVWVHPRYADTPSALRDSVDAYRTPKAGWIPLYTAPPAAPAVPAVPEADSNT